VGSHDLEPKMGPGDIVRGIYVNEIDRLKIGRFYNLVTSSDIIIRQIGDISERGLTLIPVDDGYKPINIPKSEVLEA
jgi:hypothetical protein